MNYIDLTRIIAHGMPVYPGDMPVELVSLMDVETHAVSNHALKCSMHIGTHIDAPGHMLVDGKKLTDFPVSSFIGKGKLVDARGKGVITKDLLTNVSLEKGDVVIILTGFDEHFYEKNYYSEYPAIDAGFAQALIAAGINMVGMDTPSPDYAPFAIHKALMEHDILIIENLTNVSALLGQKAFEIIALPIKVETDGALARVIAKMVR